MQTLASFDTPRSMPAPQVVRWLVAPDLMRDLRAFVERAYVAMPGDSREEVRTALKWGGLALSWLRPEIDTLIEPVVEAVEQRFPGAQLVDQFTVFRRITRKTYIYWHMDADGTGSWTRDPLFNCWMPLEDVGVDYPSLEVMTNSERVMREEGISPPGNRHDKWVQERFPEPEILCPKLNVGDALIFSHYLLHRTQPMDRLLGPRIGCEFRFAMPPDKPPRRWYHRVLKPWQPSWDGERYVS